MLEIKTEVKNLSPCLPRLASASKWRNELPRAGKDISR